MHRPFELSQQAYDLGIEFPGNTVSVMVPFNGTDEMQLNVTYSNGVDIGVMKLSSFQQWNASGLTTKAPFLPGSRTSVTVSSDPDAFSNWTVGGLSPQSSYVAVLHNWPTCDVSLPWPSTRYRFAHSGEMPCLCVTRSSAAGAMPQT